MLVLGRSKLQSVLVADEIMLTVEEICDSDNGQRIFGATVRLGFQARCPGSDQYAKLDSLFVHWWVGRGEGVAIGPAPDGEKPERRQNIGLSRNLAARAGLNKLDSFGLV